jgi:hypothetical protein
MHQTLRRPAPLLAALLLLGACGESPTAPPPPIPPTPAPVEAPLPAAAPAGLILRGAVAGDRGCYLTVEGGEDGELLAIPELCPGGPDDATRYIGQRVSLTTERATVAAAECQGDPECGETEQVEVVRVVRPAGD